MNTLKFAGLAGLISLSVLTTAEAGPLFRGPEVHDGAWVDHNRWSDPVDGDVTRGSYAYDYRVWAVARADAYVADQTKLDCADLSIALICEYAAKNSLPLSWRVYYPAEKRFLTMRNTDRQFASPAAFQEWSQWYLGAMNLADNTFPVTYEEWAGGDMVLMDWNQSPEFPNFEGRTVWHTFLIGEPGARIFYGNISDNQPLPVTSTSSASRLEQVREHPDRYGFSPRRYLMFRGAIVEPQEAPAVTAQATVIRASRLNLRSGPGTAHGVIESALRGERFGVVAREGRWVQLQLEDGRLVWAHGFYLRVEDLLPQGLVDTSPDGGLSGGLAGVLTGVSGS